VNAGGLAKGLGGNVNQFLSRATFPTVSMSSIAGKQILSANSAADLESARAGEVAAKAKTTAEVTR
jgi:hypothetical protein